MHLRDVRGHVTQRPQPPGQPNGPGHLWMTSSERNDPISAKYSKIFDEVSVIK